jgi:cell wall assembly regulator SMI1
MRLMMNNAQTISNKIDGLEKRLSIDLPPQYKNFLISGDMKNYEEQCFDFLDSTEFKNSSTIRYFFQLESNDYYDLEKTYQFYSDSERIPPDVLPIAEDFAGNLICICTNKNDAGKIYYWDHELEFDIHEYEDLSYVAPNLQSFLLDLKKDNS